MKASRQRQYELLLTAEKNIFEKIAKGAELKEVLDLVTVSIENLVDGMLCSILLLDGRQLRHGSAPSLPEAYQRAVDGVEIGPNVGSCGTAAYLAQPVVVSDIQSDPLWANYREIAAQFGLGACWSVPIKSSENTVLGTFAMYYPEPRHPIDYEFEVIERASHLAGIAVERSRAEEERRYLLQRVMTAHEDERRRVARELHDTLGQHLTAFKLTLKSLAAQNGGSGMQTVIQQLEKLTDGLFQDTHRLAWELRPVVLDDCGLGEAIERLATDFTARTNIPVDIHVSHLDDRVDPALETSTYRIIQEALNNISIHARARRASVLIEQDHAFLRVVVEDDGIGFDVEQTQTASPHRRIGLLGIKERVSQHRGTFSIESGAADGTTLFITFPLPVKASSRNEKAPHFPG